ncbi:MAG TPA: hypothetical protein VM095_13805, partial [Pyrinomonadaceae bacterium]|nr:hypothetical protein [Pyrinomonadaceae bacterium]
MAVATPRNPATPTRNLPVMGKPREADVEGWIEPLRWVALIVFIAVPAFAHMQMVEAVSGRIVWTVVVAALPLFIV